jgi:hypothetical protein
MFEAHFTVLALPRALLNDGNSMAANNVMMATTTNSSINVNARSSPGGRQAALG